MLGDLNGHALRQNASFAHAGERYTHDSTECFAAAGTGGGGATAPPDSAPTARCRSTTSGIPIEKAFGRWPRMCLGPKKKALALGYQRICTVGHVPIKLLRWLEVGRTSGKMGRARTKQKLT